MLGINKVGTSNFSSRCIKPNDKKMADLFDQERVMTQLKYTGVLETTRLRKEVGLANIANRKYQFKKAFVFTNGYLFKRSQHHATLSRQQCCTMLDENFKLKPTSSNIIKHSVQTRPACCIQQCWMMLDQHVGFV